MPWSGLLRLAALAALWHLLQGSQHFDGLRLGALTLGLAAVLALPASLLARWSATVPPRAARLLTAALLVWIAVGSLDLVRSWQDAAHFRDFRSTVLDIGDNTHCAASALLRGDNPYRLRCQRTEIVHEPSRGVVRRADGAVTLRGVPYRYGYPYFPLMAAAFVPATAFLDGVASLRATLLAALAATLLASAVLVRALRPPGSRTLAFTAAWAALLCNPVLGFQLFEECSTDLVIAPLLLLAFAAHERRRYALAGVLAAASFGMKLFPGALVLASLGVALYDDPEARRRFALGATLTMLLVFAPALLAGATDFASATLLFYAVAHDVERSALAGWIPAALRPAWYALGAALVAWSLRSARRGDASSALRAFVLADLVFLAFNKMSHLNYFEPLGPALMMAVAIAPPPRSPGATPAP
ncbi:MAG: hypothetical protein IPF99_37485 [Deltaproteobacteria bacterium]|nr:hypothetical protein [Deltaproteobacteria bacterium]